MGQIAHKKSGSVSGISKGFSLIEIIIAIALIGLMAIVVVPFFKPKGARSQDAFVAALNMLTQSAYNNGIVSGKLQRVVFDFKHDNINLEQATGKRDSAGEVQFEPVKLDYMKTSMPIPQNMLIKNFYIKGKDELRGGGTTKAWFYIMPDGKGQDVTIVTQDLTTNMIFKFVLNPFKVRFVIEGAS